MEIRKDLRSLAEFRSLLAANPHLLLENQIDQIGYSMYKAGCREPLTGFKIENEALSIGGG